jgi:hypothetical protein
VILTDSLSNIMSLSVPTSRDSWERGIQTRCAALCNAGWDVSVKFVRGHAGHNGNEIADAVCGAATASGFGFLSDNALAIPVNLCKSRVKLACRHRLIADIRRGGGFTASFLSEATGFAKNPAISSGGSKLVRSRFADRLFNRMRLGIPPIAPAGHGLDCAACGCDVESRRDIVRHWLFRCPAFVSCRQVMRERFSMLMADSASRALRSSSQENRVYGASPSLSWDSEPLRILQVGAGIVVDALASLVV